MKQFYFRYHDDYETAFTCKISDNGEVFISWSIDGEYHEVGNYSVKDVTMLLGDNSWIKINYNQAVLLQL
jgi:hypothetical protein